MSRFEGTGAYYFQSLDPREPDTDSRTGEDNEYDYEDGFLVHDDEEEQEFRNRKAIQLLFQNLEFLFCEPWNQKLSVPRA